MMVCVCVCMCVCGRERERERESARSCVCSQHSIPFVKHIPCPPHRSTYQILPVCALLMKVTRILNHIATVVLQCSEQLQYRRAELVCGLWLAS